MKNVTLGKAVKVNNGQTIQLKVMSPPTTGFDTIWWGISVGTVNTNRQVASH